MNGGAVYSDTRVGKRGRVNGRVNMVWLLHTALFAAMPCSVGSWWQLLGAVTQGGAS